MLIIDIGSASVGASVVHVSKEIPTIEHVLRIPIGVGSQETRASLEKQMLKALDELLKAYEGAYTDVRVVVASPWEEAHIRTLKSKSEKSASVSMRNIEHLVEMYKDEKPPMSGNVDVEAVAVQIRVNNYPTALEKPVAGTDVAINLYESEMSAALHKALIESVETHIHAEKIAFYTFPLIASAAIRAITDETSFTFVDIGGEVTELGVMHGDALYYLASIPSGFWSLLRDIGGERVGDARSRLALWTKNDLEPKEASSVQEKFTKSFAPWLLELEDTLKEAGAIVPIPRTLFLMSDPEPAQWIRKGIENGGTMNLAPTVIAPPAVQRFADIGEGGVFDVFLCLEAIFFHIGGDTVVGEPKPVRMV